MNAVKLANSLTFETLYLTYVNRTQYEFHTDNKELNKVIKRCDLIMDFLMVKSYKDIQKFRIADTVTNGATMENYAIPYSYIKQLCSN